jgi:hypothetical protein
VLGFTVLRQRAEGAVGTTASPAGWSVATYGGFVSWDLRPGHAELNEEASIGGFSYAYAGAPPEDQLFRYLVRRNGGDPFQVLSRDFVVPPAEAPVPPPAGGAEPPVEPPVEPPPEPPPVLPPAEEPPPELPRRIIEPFRPPVVVIPEPSSALLLGVPVAYVLRRRARR